MGGLELVTLFVLLIFQNSIKMKNTIICLTIAGMALFTACNNNRAKKEVSAHEMNTMNTDTAPPASKPDDKEVNAVAVTFTNMDAEAAASIKEMVSHYLHIKNALANDNGSDAADGAKEMESAMNKMDKSLLTAAQKKVYDAIEEDLQEHAKHIGKNGDNIEHQRSHFSMMSEDLFDLVKAFGGGRPMYHDHCPMYNDNMGAMWLSEVKEIKNPYFGAQMPTCGKLVEVIR